MAQCTSLRQRNIDSAWVGRTVTEADVAAIRPGVSEAELTATLGRAVEKSLTVENELVLSWGFSKMEQSLDPRHRYQTLRVFLDGNNRVRNYVIVGDVGLPPTAK